MGELKIVRLHFRSALHLGMDVPGIGIEASRRVAHSDTLFSCLINSYAELHSGDASAVEKLLEPFRAGEPPFRMSSAFPFQMRSEYDVEYYLPKPIVAPPIFYDSAEGQWAKQEYSKLVRNTMLVGMDTFHNWLQGAAELLDALEEQDIDSFCAREVRPQHARDRLTDATNIYHTGLVHFTGSSGLYFIIELNNKALLDWNAFEVMLRHAGLNGLGGRRSIGNGVFNVTDDTIMDLDQDWKDLFDLPVQDGDGFINLSLYLPEKFDILKPIAYQLVPRRGWCYSSVTPIQMKRKAVMMFSEGSVFRNEPNGTLADVTPCGFTAHKLYRYGIPISLPIKILETDDDVS